MKQTQNFCLKLQFVALILTTLLTIVGCVLVCMFTSNHSSDFSENIQTGKNAYALTISGNPETMGSISGRAYTKCGDGEAYIALCHRYNTSQKQNWTNFAMVSRTSTAVSFRTSWDNKVWNYEGTFSYGGYTWYYNSGQYAMPGHKTTGNNRYTLSSVFTSQKAACQGLIEYIYSLRTKLTKPTLTTSSFTYAASAINLVSKNAVSGYDSSKMGISGHSQTNVGNYSVTFSISDTLTYQWADGNSNSFSISWKITQANNSWTTTPSIAGWTYGATAANPAGAAKWGTVVREYKVSSAADSTYTTTKPSNAGTYTMRSSVAATTNYKVLTHTVNFTIAQANNSWTTTPSIAGWTYGATAANPAGAAKWGTVVREYKVSSAADSTYTTTKPSNAGTYTMRSSVAATTNYKVLTHTVNFTIAKAKVNIPTVTADLTFNNQNQSPTISFDTLKCQTTSGSTTSAFHAGDYTITIEIIDKTNYEFTDGTQSKTFTWTIKRFNIGDAIIVVG